jgi:glycosyltransferase involved in cell wall biosynthesis
MKLIYVTASLPYGTGEAFLIPEIQELRAQGHKVLIVPLFPRGPVLHCDAQALVEITAKERVFSWRILLKATGEALQHPRRTMSATWGLKESRTLRIATKNAAVFSKGVWLAHLAKRFDADHIHAHWGGCTASIAMVASEVSGISWSFTVHSWEILENNLLSIKARNAAFVRIVSQFGKNRFQKTIDSTVAIEVLHLGIYMPKRPMAEDGDRPALPQILVVAMLEGIKGHRYLIDAWAKLHGRGITVKIECFGGGSLQGELEDQVQRIGGGDYISFYGWVPHALVLTKMSAGNWEAIVLPSIIEEDSQQEGIPISLVEAMAYGLPVIATETGGIPELLGEGAGILVPERDSDALADAIETLISSSELRRTLRANALKKVEQEFAVEKVVRELTQMMCGHSAETSP